MIYLKFCNQSERPEWVSQIPKGQPRNVRDGSDTMSSLSLYVVASWWLTCWEYSHIQAKSPFSQFMPSKEGLVCRFLFLTYKLRSVRDVYIKKKSISLVCWNYPFGFLSRNNIFHVCSHSVKCLKGWIVCKYYLCYPRTQFKLKMLFLSFFVLHAFWNA